LLSSIVDQLRNFFCHGFSDQGDIISPNYQQKVLTLDKSPLRASLLWLKGARAIDDADIERFQLVRRQRNEIAHQLVNCIAFADEVIDPVFFATIADLVMKIDRWWIREVEIPVNPDFDGRNITESEIQSGRMISLHLLIRSATDSETSFYDEFVNQASKAFEAGQAT